jgi:hypothetical protein
VFRHPEGNDVLIISLGLKVRMLSFLLFRHLASVSKNFFCVPCSPISKLECLSSPIL